jgi:hypothetical protein
VARFRRLEASPRTRVIVSWTIGVVVVVVAWLLLRWLGDQLGWSWP